MIDAPTCCNVPVSGIDFYPTLLDIAGIPVRKSLYKAPFALLQKIQYSKSERFAEHLQEPGQVSMEK